MSYQGILYLSCGDTVRCLPADIPNWIKKLENYKNPPKTYCPICKGTKKVRSAA